MHVGHVTCREGRERARVLCIITPAEAFSSWGLSKYDGQWVSSSLAAVALMLHTWLPSCTHAEPAKAMPTSVVSKESSTAWQGISQSSIIHVAGLLAHPRGGGKLAGWATALGSGWIGAKISTCPTHMHEALLQSECSSQHCGARLTTPCYQCKHQSSACRSHAVCPEK